MVPIGLFSLPLSVDGFSSQHRAPNRNKLSEQITYISGDGVWVAVHKKTWPCNKLIEMKTMNDGKHKENYWLIKSPIFKRIFISCECAQTKKNNNTLEIFFDFWCHVDCWAEVR